MVHGPGNGHPCDRVLCTCVWVSLYGSVRDGLLHGKRSHKPGIYRRNVCDLFRVIYEYYGMEVVQMIIRMKVKQREEQKGEEYEFKGPDAIDLTIETLLTKYGIRTRTFI